MMKKYVLSGTKSLIFSFLLTLVSVCGWGQDIFISQYIETNSGTTPKGVEIMNPTSSDIVFSETNNLQIYQGTNGGSCGSVINITSGTLKAGEVWIIGTSDLTTYATENGTALSGTTTFAFSFNGDDALQLRLGGVIKDVFGTCGIDPGTAWTGDGVSTANNNLQIKNGICIGTTSNWTDPSLRFDQIANGSTMTGFGNAPSCISGFTVTFKGNGADGGGTGGTGADYTQTASTTTALTTNTFTRTGHTFDHWNTQNDDGGTDYANGANYDFLANINLYAQWSINQYNVSYDINGGTGTAPTTQTGDYNSNITLADDTGFSRAGYTFTGWNTAANGSGDSYTSGGNFTIPGNNTLLYAQWQSTLPSITTTGTITAMTAEYGSVSTNRNFSFTGANLSGSQITVTPPAGFEIAKTSGGPYSTSLNYAISEGSSNGTVYIRLAGTTDVGTYSGNVNLSDGTTNATVSIPNSTVTPKALTITGLTVNNKVYDGNTTASLGGSPTLNGIVNSDVVNLGGTPTANFNTKNVGNNKAVTVSGYTISGADAGNYTLTQPTGLQANITAKNLTVTGAVAQNKTYDGTTTATITGANLQGVISPDVVTVSGGGTFASPNAGTGISVTANLTLGGSDAGNYTLTQPTGLSADITKANPVFTTSTINLTVSGTYTLPGANISSTSNGGYNYSITGDGHATYDGVTTLTAVSVGTETLTVNQAATPNFNAGSTTVTVNVALVTYTLEDYKTINGTGLLWNNANHWQKWNGSGWGAPGADGTPSSSRNVYIYGSMSTNGSRTANKIIIESGGTLTISASSTATSQTWVKDGGILQLNAAFTNSGNFDVESNGTVNINYSTASGVAAIWNGTENFHSGSNFNIQNWNYGASSGNNRLVQNPSIITPNSNGFYFGNLTISGSPTSIFVMVEGTTTVNLCENNFTSSSTGSNVAFTNAGSNVTIGGDVFVTSGQLSMASTTNGTPEININGNLTSTSGNINLNQNSSANALATVNLKGDLSISSFNTFISTDAQSNFNFSGTGDGLTPETTQTIDVANSSTASNIAFNVNSGAYVQLVNQNLALGASSSFTVKNGGIFDFGFSGSNALNITNHVNSANFTTEPVSTIKITSPDGITTSTGSGNVQTMTTGRTYNPAGIYHYIGKENQVTGNGLPGGIASDGTEIKVIADLDDSNPVSPYDDRLTLTVNGMINLNTTGELEIRRGTVIDAPNNGFSDATSQNAKLTMSNGRYKIFRTAGSTQPALGGTYTLTGGVIEFAGNGTFNIRTDKDYLNVEVTGSDVTAGTTENSGLSFLENGTFKVMNEGVFKVNNLNGFSGDSTTAVKNTNNPSITLEDGSTVEYTRADDQLISAQNNVGQGEGNYYNLKISGSGTKTATTGTTTINGMTSLISTDAVLLVPATNEDENPNVFKALGGIENKLDENTTGTFRLGNNAQLIQHTDTRDNADNSKAKIEAQRLVTSIHNTTGTGGQMDYIYWSTPVGNQKLQSFSPNTPSNRFYEYIESTDLFKSINAQDNFISGKGYAIRAENGITQGNDKTYTFAGTPNNGDITFVDGIKKSSSTTGGYNLVGNPYPSNIDADAMFAENPEIYTTAFFWTNKNYNFPTQQGSTYDGSNYAVYNNVGGNPATYDATMDDDTPTNIIKVGQGFIVQKIEEGTSDFVFHNNMRITEKGNFYEKNTNPKNRFWITLTSPANLVNTMLIGYIQGATNDYEKNYDAESLSVGSDAVYSVLEDKKLAIQGRNYLFDKEDKIPMGTNQYQSGIYTIALKNPEGIFASDQKIYLHDKLNDSYTNLSENNYQFDAEAGSTENRFEIVYQPNDATLATDLSSKENLWVYRNGENFVVKSTVNINEIEVYDVSGRLQQKIKGNTKEIVISGSALVSGMYVLKIKRGNDLSSEKIIK